MADSRPKSFTPSVFKGSEEVVECPCVPCARVGTTKEAINFCTDCSEFICDDCTQYHMKFGITATHDVVDKTKADKAGRGNKSSLGQLPTERCREHKGELITSFCIDHDVVVCNSCATMDHRSCENMAYIPKISGKSQFRQAVPRTKAEVTASLKAARMARVHVQNHKAMIDNEKAKNVANIKDHTKRLKDHASEMEKSSIADVTKHHQESSNKIMSELASLDESEKILQKRLNSLDNSQINNDSQVFVDTKLGIREADAVKQLERRLESNEPVKSKFVVDDRIDSVLSGMNSLGKVVICKPFRAVLKDTYDMNKKGDEDVSGVCDSCELPDGDILLSDYYNKCIKVLSKNKVAKRFKMTNGPWGICQINSNTIAVTLTVLKMVEFVDINSWKITTSFPVEDHCRGIAYSKYEFFVSCGGHPVGTRWGPEGPPCVAVYDVSGSLRRKIQLDGHGKLMFSVPRHIATSQNGSKIHISDEKNGVISVDRQGTILSTFSEGISWPLGLCTIGECNLIVCDIKSHNIVQITTDGEFVAELLSKRNGLDKPYSLLYSPEKSTLMVTFDKSNEIKVYNLH